MNANALARFLPKFQIAESGCWEWIAARNATGYGKFSVKRSVWRYSHRLAYEHWRGPIPAGLVTDHLCRNTRCVNPSHLEIVTPAENARRGIHRNGREAWSHCAKGHPFDERNTYRDKYGHRGCRTCGRDKTRRQRAAASASI